MHKKSTQPFLLIITGPTASGKSTLAMKIAKLVPSEIINADVGQFYTQFSVGTAKPDWKSSSIKQHLFDIIDSPKNISVSQYRVMLLKVVDDILKKNKLPIIVGGSLFYLKSLFYPPLDLPGKPDEIAEPKELWEKLNEIDPKRAEAIHPNDSYRIKRALSIWEQTGEKPSLYAPKFNPGFNSKFIFLNPPKEILKKRISERTLEMLSDSGNWIEEVVSIIGTEWEEFLEIKKLIGYPEIIKWIKDGKDPETLEELILAIQRKTWDYARRQMIFWKSFSKMLKDDSSESTFQCEACAFEDDSDKTAFSILRSIDDKEPSL